MFKKVTKKVESKRRIVSEEEETEEIQPTQEQFGHVPTAAADLQEQMQQQQTPIKVDQNGVGQSLSVVQKHDSTHQSNLEVEDSDEEGEDEGYRRNPTGAPTKRRKIGVSVRSLDQAQQQVPAHSKINQKFESASSIDQANNSVGVGLISAGGKQPQFQFIQGLGKFEFKDKKLEEYLKSQLNSSTIHGKSDFDLEQEERQKQLQAVKDQLLQEQKELYKIPLHLDVDRLKDDRRLIDHTNWISGLIEVQVSQERKIKNVEAAENLRLQQLRRELDIVSSGDKKMIEFDSVTQSRKHGQFHGVRSQKDDLMKMVEREMMQKKQSRQKVRDVQEKRDTNRRQEEMQQRSHIN